jgi:hydroxymethylpyrimidine/phosphomethylpyrimidine kinase
VASPPAFIALTIAGSDPTAGAGIQGDLATFRAHGVRGASVVTAVTAQNADGVTLVHAVPERVVVAQLEAVLAKARPSAVKTGMLHSAATAEAVASTLEAHGPLGLEAGCPLVVDPVLDASAGGLLSTRDLVAALVRRVFPLATLVTPNVPEAERLLGRTIGADEVDEAASALLELGRSEAVLVKGGHLPGDARDVLATRGGVVSFSRPRVDTPHAHGTGCALAAAIAARLARGEKDLARAVLGAKDYVRRALLAAAPFGSGPGCVRHDVAADA